MPHRARRCRRFDTASAAGNLRGPGRRARPPVAAAAEGAIPATAQAKGLRGRKRNLESGRAAATSGAAAHRRGTRRAALAARAAISQVKGQTGRSGKTALRPCFVRLPGDAPAQDNTAQRRPSRRGARMVDFGGWDMPVNYGSQIEEHHAVRRDAGMFDVSHMRVVDLDGRGRARLPALRARQQRRQAAGRRARRSTRACCATTAASSTTSSSTSCARTSSASSSTPAPPTRTSRGSRALLARARAGARAHAARATSR